MAEGIPLQDLANPAHTAQAAFSHTRGDAIRQSSRADLAKGIFCPCILYGETEQLLHESRPREDGAHNVATGEDSAVKTKAIVEYMAVSTILP